MPVPRNRPSLRVAEGGVCPHGPVRAVRMQPVTGPYSVAVIGGPVSDSNVRQHPCSSPSPRRFPRVETPYPVAREAGSSNEAFKGRTPQSKHLFQPDAPRFLSDWCNP